MTSRGRPHGPGGRVRRVPPAQAESLVIVSPHLDDAVLSCGRLLAAHPGTYVVTVFSSGPEKVDPLPWWDQLCGVFRPGDDVMALRRQEDAAAMALVGAEPRHLGFWDGQYRALSRRRWARLVPPGVRRRMTLRHDDHLVARIRAALARVVEERGNDTWLVPLGLHRGDHELVARACIDMVGSFPDTRWLLYEEQPYRSEEPGKVETALTAVRRAGYAVETVELDVDPTTTTKDALVRCHRSQLAALDHRVQLAIDGPEVFHELSVSVPATR